MWRNNSRDLTAKNFYFADFYSSKKTIRILVNPKSKDSCRNIKKLNVSTTVIAFIYEYIYIN